MIKILRGYKQGRSFVSYDILDEDSNRIANKVDKDTVAKMCDDKVVTNATVQWWQGKPIVRLKDDSVEIVKIEDDGNEKKMDRTVHKTEDVKQVAVSKPPRKSRNETIYERVNKKEIEAHRKLSSSIKYDNMKTLGDLFDVMVKEFGLKNIETYKGMMSRKIKMDTMLSSLARQNLMNIQQSMAIYLMNMANIETRETYVKYLPVDITE